MRVNIKDFLNKYRNEEYRHGIYIPEDIYIQCSQKELDLLLNNDTNYLIELPDNIVDIIEENKRAQELRDSLYNEISIHRTNGIALEKDDITKAVNEYALSIKIGEQTNMFRAYAHSYERIIVLLHKLKDYKSEINYITQYLKHNLSDGDFAKYQKRLELIKSKIK